MAEKSGIAWCDDTANGWGGCCEVRLVVRTIDGRFIPMPSECDNCYAKIFMANRQGFNGKDASHPVLWGDPHTTPRHKFKYLPTFLPNQEREAMRTGRRLVFCFSLSDVFEEHPMVGPWRNEFFELVDRTPHLDYLLLTKRPQNVLRMVPGAWIQRWPEHVWVGTSTGTQESLDRRMYYLDAWRDIGVPVRFLSIEPQLGEIDVRPAIDSGANWIITGGESGSDTGLDRPRIDANLDWFRRVRDDCGDANVAYFHKQHGGRRPGGDATLDGQLWHQWPDTGLGPVGGVRAAGQLI